MKRSDISSEEELLGDRYALEAPIGQGRSTVYRAVDIRLRREVAVKQVRLISDDEDREHVRIRALREARAAARLNHPRVVTVYDIVEYDDALWLVMELVEAPSLAQLVVGSGPLPHDRAARIGMDVLGALAAAHAVGVVHRDVKPANVLVTGSDRAKLADFGVATIRDHTRVTATGRVVGSPAYMAPEQAMGEQAGPPADLWALGATLYFAVEGTPPFGGDSALATLSAVVHGAPRPQEHPGPLSPLLAELLSRDPARRPSAPEVGVALAEAADGDHRSGAIVFSRLPGGVRAERLRRRPSAAPTLRPDPRTTTASLPAVTPTPIQPLPPEDLPPSAPAPAPDQPAELSEAGEPDEPPPPATPSPGDPHETAATESREDDADTGDHRVGPVTPAPLIETEATPDADGLDQTGHAPVPAEPAAPGEAVVSAGASAPAEGRGGRRGPGEARRRGERRRGERPGPVVVALAVLVVLLAFVPWVVSRLGEGDHEAGGSAGRSQGTEAGAGNDSDRTEEADDESPSASASSDDTTPSGQDQATATTGEPASPPATAVPSAEQSAVSVPDDWVPYENPEGTYTIRYPPGWQVEPATGPRIDFRDPATGIYLRVDWTTEPKPDPVADWQQQAQHFAATHTGYEEIRIEPYDYRDYDAALWEFRYRVSSGQLHVGNLGFVTADGQRAYALYFQTSEGRWAASQTLFAQFREAFRPA